MPSPRHVVALGISAGLGALVVTAAGAGPKTAPRPIENETGASLTVNKRNRIDTSGPFFQQLGTNGRSCDTCHAESDGWSLSAASARRRFEETSGEDPLFRTNDGTVSPHADVSTLEAKRSAYALLLSRGVFRIGLPMPQEAEFTLEAVDDPYGFASAAELSLFRRSLPAANLKFQSTIMWDGRQTTPGFTLEQNLASQALDATLGHAQAGARPTDAQLAEIVKFERGLFHAQIRDSSAGKVTAEGARGGPRLLSKQKYQPGINDPFGGRKPFNPIAFKLFSKWAKSRASNKAVRAERQSVARGEVIFNRKRFTVTGVAGFNDVLGAPAVTATCTSCHNAPNVGSSSVGVLQDIGVSAPQRRSSDVPLYTFRNRSTGEVRSTTDPGRALITGKWSDMDRFKVSPLRGLAARAPYFHDGSAATLLDVVQFYDTRFQLNLTLQQKADLVAFLRSL
ncbi:MAG: hypothetical protein ACK47B_06570 [Armatimonadota bacterium]